MLNFKPWHQRSLRTKLSVMAGCVAALVVAGFGAGVSWHLSDEIFEHFDAELAHTAQSVLERWEENPDADKMAQATPFIPLFYFHVEQPPGTVIFRSKTIAVPPAPSDVSAVITETTFGDLQLRWAAQRKGDLLVRVAANHYIVDETVDDVMLVFLAATPVALIVAVLGAHWFMRRAFRPFEIITRTVEHITAERLDERLPAPAVDDELGHLTRVLNNTIDRLEGSFQQSARFAADASHELRTPLTLLRAEIERAMESPDLPPHCQEVLARLLEHSNDLSSITEALLLLSRADAGKLMQIRKPIELCSMLMELKEDLEALAINKDLDVEVELTPESWVMGDASLLRHLIYNLFENAVKYNDMEGSVRVVLEPDGNMHRLRVANTGKGIAKEQAALIFERFFRTDPSREQIRGHGLGLSLCREIARAHGGEVMLLHSGPGWTEFWVTLPAAETPHLGAGI